MKLLIDTDIGADVDDSFAILSAFTYSEVDVLGITTVFKNVVERGKIAKKLCLLLNRRIPVYAGSGDTIVKEQNKNEPTYFHEDFDSSCLPDNFGEENGEAAVDFIIDCAEKYANKLNILAIGPLTNIAKAIKKAPLSMKRVGKITIMGGCYFNMRPEWNIFCDPEGAEIVFNSDINLHAVGSDVTNKTRLPFELQEKITGRHKEGGAIGYVCNHAKIWMDKRKYAITLHDPLAFYSILKPEVVHFKKQRIAVETKGEHTRGITFNYSLTGIYPKECGKIIYVADYVDEKAVIDEFMNNVINKY